MKCPRCAEPDLVAKTIETVEFDECPRCGGVWLDQGELEQAKDLVAPDLRWWDFEIWKHPEQFKLVENPLFCPNDSKEMLAINYGSTNIEIDVCSQCRGIWLDGGEFDKIIEALNNELANAEFSDYVRASLEEGKEVITGEGGVRSEWKDFTTVLRLMQYRIFVEKPRLLGELLDAQKGAPIW
jgi:Zn-finger nucleic acid-binding protein